jgi:pyruvate formate lyase activating enzyme
MQPAFLAAVLEACGKLELHRTVDTSGYGDTRHLLDAAARAELFLYDLKHMDPDRHMAMTGITNAVIISNLKALAGAGANIIVRIPIIPGINCDAANINQTGSFISSLPGVDRVNILPYHRAAVAKYDHLGSEFPTPEIETPSPDLLESIAARLAAFDLNVKIGG